MPRNRDYKKEYKFHSTPEQKKRRAARNKARADAIKAGKVKKGDSREVHHKDGNPKNHSKGNEVVVSKTYNRKKQARGPARKSRGPAKKRGK